MTSQVTDRPRPRWQFWRSPTDQPRWARPLLLGMAALAGAAYGWGMTHQVVEIYYAAAVRSMAQNWHNFFFAAFDPDATVTLDKLPGALWPQALLVKAFGPQVWALVLPQVVEGVLTVLVLYSAVRRLAGPFAGIVAAAVVTVTPAVVALNRGNVADSLMILLMVCATDAVARGLTTRRPGPLLAAGVWVGLAFQAKMLEAWLVVPAIGLVWLLAGAAGRWLVRLRQVVLFGLVTVAVSLVWVVAVSLVPAADRPVVDGSEHNSVFEQVFVYNGFGRVTAPTGHGAPIPSGSPLLGVTLDNTSWLDRTVAGQGGRAIGWLLPLAVLAGVAVLLVRRRAPRTDPVRACCVLWGGWLVTALGLFAVAGTLNAYYLATLAPAVAALVGVGAAEAVPALRANRADGADRPDARRTALVASLAAVAGTVAYGGWLTPGGPARLAVVGAGVVALALGAALLVRPTGRPRLGAGLLLAALAVAPVAAAGSLVAQRWGPFDTPYEPAATTALTQGQSAAIQRGSGALAANLRRVQGTARYPAATVSALLAAPMIFASGAEVLPIGGFSGMYPSPSVDDLRALVARGQLHLVITPPEDDPRVAWVQAHCMRLPRARTAASGPLTADLATYYCSASGAGSP